MILSEATRAKINILNAISKVYWIIVRMKIFNAKFNKWKSRSIVTVSIIKFDSFPLLYNELHMHRICVNVGNSSKALLYEMSVYFFFLFFFLNFLLFLPESYVEHRIQLNDRNNRKIVSSISRIFKERYRSSFTREFFNFSSFLKKL